MSRKIAILISFMAMVVAIGACGGGLSEEETGALSEAASAAPIAAAPATEQQLVKVSGDSANFHSLVITDAVDDSEYNAQPGGFNAIGGSATVNDAAYDLTFFQHHGVNPFIDTEDDHFSTFAVDVDTASYTVARRFVQDGNIPVPDSVRVEEFVNYFEHDYAPPESGAFAVHIEGSPSPFGGENHWMLRVGLEGKAIPQDARKNATLVFAIDVSGSMGREDRLGLVQRSLRLLVEELRPADRVGIVVYGNRGRVLLEPTDGGERQAIMGAINSLVPSGSTYVEDGLRLAYKMAAEEVQPGRITRVLLLSDGVGNVGRTGAESILSQIRPQVDAGVSLTTIGFGMGNFNDVLMEQLANDGDGAYHYVDTLTEARRVFVENLVDTLQNIAKDTKVQVDFNPAVVRSYRLLGYENRDVADEDFRDDGVVSTVFLRYEDPDTGEINEISRQFQRNELVSQFLLASPKFQLSTVVAEYAEILRESYWARESSLQTVADEAARLRRLIPEDADIAEFASLTAKAEQLWTSAGR